MIDPIDRKLLRQNLVDIASIIDGLEYFIFYGTMLGIVRENDIIAHDDDIDILINIKHRDELIYRLEKSQFAIDFTRPFNKKSNCFVQAQREVESATVYVDFYFYENKATNDYIIDRWNFKGACNTPSTALHIPKDLVFPLTITSFNDTTLSVPNQAEALCAFLYGETWRTPVKKNSEYTIEIEHHRPKFIRKETDKPNKATATINISDLDQTGQTLASHYKSLDRHIADIENTLRELNREKKALEPLIRSHLKC